MAEVFTIAGAPPLGATACPDGWMLTPNGNCGGDPPQYIHPAARALQTALKMLAKVTGDKSLVVREDGIIGPFTTAAVNKAMTAHIGPGQAPAPLRTGILDIGAVAQNAATLAQAINSEAARRGGSIAPPGPLPPPVPSDVAGLSSGLMWGLVGLNLVFAGVGAYLHATREG